jgi:hypothetical protein
LTKIPTIVKTIQQQPIEEINHAYQRSISYSQMSVYNTCSYRWKLQYKDGVDASSFGIHATFGTALHETLQHYFNIMYNVSGAEADRIEIEEYFKEKFIEQYQITYKQNKSVHFSTPQELREFHDDGIEMIRWFKQHKSDYFSKKGWHLVGCEIPLLLTPDKRYKNVLYKGYLDLVLYHEPTNTIKIIDIKTSTRGWSDKEKKDESKQYQLILYKEFLSRKFNIEPDNIEVEFFIIKRKIYTESEFPQKRVQIFIPPSGKIKTKKAVNAVTKFIEEAFETDGSIKEREYEATPSKWNCSYCPFKNKKEFCDKGIS